MNRLLNRFFSFNRNNVSAKLLASDCIQMQTNFNFHIYCFQRHPIILNNCLHSKQLLTINRVFFPQSMKWYSNGKTERKVKPRSDKISADNEFQLKSKKRILRKKSVLDKNESHLPIFAFSTADEYNIEELGEALKDQGLYESLPLTDDVDDVLHLSAKYQINNNKRQLFIFREGSIVCWNMPFVECEAILKFLRPFEHNSYDENIVDEEKEQMNFEFVNSKSKLQKGLICLNTNKEENERDLEKYAFSDAIALSVKLSIWESSLDRYIHSIEFVSQDMKEGRKIKLNRDQVFRKTGELFDLKHHINLSSDLLDTPDFYWDRQELEKLFSDTIYFLNIRKRTNVMNEKLSHCIELMELLSSHLNDKHSSSLEWMIIILIMVEIVFEAIHYIERLF